MTRLGVLAALVCLAGCSAPPPTAPAGTGAKEAARAYFEGIVRKDWPAAYATLAAEAKAKVSADRFVRLGDDYRRNLGFDPEIVHVTDCDEHGDAAVAHVTLTGKGAHHRRFKDAVTLKRDAAGWAVVLPANFGRAK